MDALFFNKNRKKLIETMEDNSCLIMFSGSPPKASRDQYYYFQPDRNFYYLTGIEKPNMILFISKHSGVDDVILFMPDEKSNISGPYGHPITCEDVAVLSGIHQVVYIEAFDNILSRHIARKPCEIVYFDFNRININDLSSKSEIYANGFKKKYPSLKILNIHKMICNFRTIKSIEEIDEIRKAIKITSCGIIDMMKCCKPFIYESDLEAEFMYCLYKNKERISAFSNIIASGKNALIGHYSANNQMIEDNVLVQIDVGAQSKWYCADVSRAIPSNGIFNSRQKQLYNICDDALNKLIEYIEPGITAEQSVEYGNSLIIQSLSEIGITKENTNKLSVYCGINHYIGLDVHDVGDRSLKLIPNMVVAVDSAIGLPDEDFYFRIEDDLLITEIDCEVLTCKIPKTIEDIERIMQNGKS